MKSTVSRILDASLSSDALRPLARRVWDSRAKALAMSGIFEAKHIFIVGCGHSGTSILLAKLDNHTRVSAIRGESRFFQIDPIRRAYLLRRWFEQWRPDLVLAEKTPVHVRYVTKIRRIFPNAKVIGITRHPLDAVASLLKRHKGVIDNEIDRWKKDNRALLEEFKKGNVDIIIKYEQFVVSPEETLVNVQHACLLPVEPGISVMTGDKRGWYMPGRVSDHPKREEESHAQRRQRQINEAIFDGRGGYKEVLSEAQVRYVKERTAGLAVELGYDVDSIDG